MIDVLVMLFALYGILMLAYQLVAHFMQKTSEKSGVPAAIVVVDNAQDWIEWFVRKLALNGFVQGKPVDVFIVDTGGSTETLGIVSRLQPAHPFITYIASSDVHGNLDILTLLQSTRRSQAFVATLHDERDIERFLLAWRRIIS